MSDAAVLWRMLRGMPQGGTHAAKLEGFYRGQAGAYDRFREKLLHGRDELLRALPLHAGQSLIEFGCGTGRNVSAIRERGIPLSSISAIDLCPSLLSIARRRAIEGDWREVEIIEADACVWRPPQPVDAVIFAYALTMIPDRDAAIANARACLKPGGVIAVVDFTTVDADVAALHRGPRVRPQSRLVRAAWQRWFAHDGVHPGVDLLPALHRSFTPVDCRVGYGGVPYLPLKAGYFTFMGRTPN